MVVPGSWMTARIALLDWCRLQPEPSYRGTRIRRGSAAKRDGQGAKKSGSQRLPLELPRLGSNQDSPDPESLAQYQSQQRFAGSQRENRASAP